MLELKLSTGEIIKIKEGSKLLPIAQKLQEQYAAPIMEGVLNGRDYDLQRPIYESGTLDFITLGNENGMRVYIRTLLFLFITTVNRLYPKAKLEVHNTMGSSLYVANKGKALNLRDWKIVEEEMHRLVAAKAPISLEIMPKNKAIIQAGAYVDEDRKALLKKLPEDAKVYVYYLEEQPGYFFGALCPDCSYVPLFGLIPVDNGVMVDYPDTDNWQKLSPWGNIPLLYEAFEEAERWAALINCNTIAKLNQLNKEGKTRRLIQIAEALHEKKLANIADMVYEKIKDLKLVLIAGPSSSGKTSTAQRLSIQLAVNGLEPIPISMDDYYKNRVDTPKKADGTYDFECVEAIDVDLFNEHITKLLRGERVEIPKFNFKTGVREYHGNVIQLQPNSLLVVEGIHGLNEKLTEKIPAANKLKIYVSALTPMSIDDYNRINTTDVRLMRRMVRDNQFRGRPALMTLNQWADVRYGEEKYIFPFQNDADIIFNTTLIYEIAVLKKYAEPLLQAVKPEDGAAYATAHRLLGLLHLVDSIDDSAIPNNSIIREFVGGSIFSDVL